MTGGDTSCTKRVSSHNDPLTDRQREPLTMHSATSPNLQIRHSRSAIMVIIVAELLCTSLWFSGNSITDALKIQWNLDAGGIGWLTNATQAGFIVGTLAFATSGLADRCRASRIFFVSSMVGALANAGFALVSEGLLSALAFRLLIGLCLAGIYPIGMKLILTWTQKHSGFALALLVGMLTLGTALPHAIRAIGANWPWQAVVLTSSVLTLAGGILVFRQGEGPFLSLRPAAGRRAFNWRDAFHPFRIDDFRAAALGYFGHMWELYAFWTIIPLLLIGSSNMHTSGLATAAMTFVIIAAGTLGCITGGLLVKWFGSGRIAFAALLTSGVCCCVYPLLAQFAPGLTTALFIVWGIAVVADSPQFSNLSAQACPPEQVGAALAIQNSIGFALTLIAIFLVTSLYAVLGDYVSWILLPGPVFGLWAMRQLVRNRP